jgi:hypothetical protein
MGAARRSKGGIVEVTDTGGVSGPPSVHEQTKRRGTGPARSAIESNERSASGVSTSGDGGTSDVTACCRPAGGPTLDRCPSNTCQYRALGVSHATIYRRRRPPEPRPAKPRPAPPRTLSEAEREAVLEVLHSARFVDCPPAQVYATLLDEGQYLASERTMSRLLEANGEVRGRRDQLTHPAYAAPELLAERPNEVWSWDISKLKGPAKWTWFYLYVILDVFSRFVARHKTAVLFPDSLCGRRRRRPAMTGASGQVVAFSGT